MAENEKTVPKEQKITGAERQQRGLFKKRRAGIVLSKDEVLEIKAGRKALKAEMKARELYNRKDFELTAASLGLYFDKSRILAILWFFRGKGLWILLAAALATLAAIWLTSQITQLRGHFTINMSADMFREGFVLSETEDFEKPTTYLFCEPAVDVPCISIQDLPEDLDTYEGQHNANYFAYTFFVRNEGESTVGYRWQIGLNSESQSLSDACWVMVFEDGEMAFYAEMGADGAPEALPAVDDNTRGYLKAPLMEFAKDPDRQYEVIAEKGALTYYRLTPIPFESDKVVASGIQTEVKPMDVHRYTVVIWLEGDDPECTNDKIGGHVGMQMDLTLIEE